MGRFMVGGGGWGGTDLPTVHKNVHSEVAGIVGTMMHLFLSSPCSAVTPPVMAGRPHAFLVSTGVALWDCHLCAGGVPLLTTQITSPWGPLCPGSQVELEGKIYQPWQTCPWLLLCARHFINSTHFTKSKTLPLHSSHFNILASAMW